MTPEGGCSAAFKTSLNSFLDEYVKSLKRTWQMGESTVDPVKMENSATTEKIVQQITGATARQLEVLAVVFLMLLHYSPFLVSIFFLFLALFSFYGGYCFLIVKEDAFETTNKYMWLILKVSLYHLKLLQICKQFGQVNTVVEPWQDVNSCSRVCGSSLSSFIVGHRLEVQRIRDIIDHAMHLFC